MNLFLRENEFLTIAQKEAETEGKAAILFSYIGQGLVAQTFSPRTLETEPDGSQ